MKIKAWEAALAAALIIALICGTVISDQQDDLNNKLIRLHVVANSDSKEDQNLKIKVKNTVVNNIERLLKDADSKQEATELITYSLDELKTAAALEIEANGYKYPVSVSMREEEFPTREYNTFSLPAGKYDSLRITIGDGNGQNWWCVVFPPVCAAGEMTVADAAAIGLTKDEYKLITEDSGGYVIKFRFMEFLGKLKTLW